MNLQEQTLKTSFPGKETLRIEKQTQNQYA